VKIYVAVPAYDGRITIETARSLCDEQVMAALSGIELSVQFVPGGSLVTTVRDRIASDFLASGADRLVFIDSDVSWNLGDLVKLAQYPVDFVGGCYRYKQEPEGYPVMFLDKEELWADPETGLIEVAAVPAGFLSLSRAVFEQLQAATPNRAYKHFEKEMHAFFHAPPGGGEDGAFCTEWRAIGGKVWLAPEMKLTHTGGSRDFTGTIGDWLRNR
jgi:hypothetical protein